MQIQTGIKKAAALCVLKHKDSFLLLKRNKEPNAGMYAPVGGKIDPFETPKQAAIRETFEETGIQVPDMNYCGVLTESSPSRYNWISFIYIAEIEFMEPPPCDEGTLEWISAKNLSKIPMPPTDLIIYTYILDNKQFAFNAIYDAELNMTQLIEEIAGVRILDI
jgi:8-oxo-dGTP diphosphatase